ncbi:acyl-CoA dehydrogenase family protein [Micrococcales bacterium 31B]|nr:acyl-CoA dehydrogenase family protein [Micrococcales bacterium 31B]
MATAPYTLEDPLDTDLFEVFSDVPDSDRVWWRAARQFVTDEVLPTINEAWESARYPVEWLPRLGALDLLRDGVATPTQPAASPLAVGLMEMELARGDGSLSTIVGVQGGLAMRSIQMHGSDEQRATYLPRMAAGELFGAFALTEPEHGSDSVSLETTARRDGDSYVLSGRKKWIGNGASGGISVVWARMEDGQVGGFIVPQETPGYQATVITGKVSLRAIHQAEITLADVRIPASLRLPGATSFKDTAAVLQATRLGVAWAALGHAIAGFDAALAYAKQRVQFGKPLGGFQLVQARLADMAASVSHMQLMLRRAADLDGAGRLTGTQASLCKLECTRLARALLSDTRDLLGGNGILLENHVIRHLADMEAVHTYEGTASVQQLLIGRALTGFSAFT